METTEHIVESYVRFVRGWFTNSNIKCKNGKEIDILAIDPITGKKYHIECGITHTKAWALKKSPSKTDYSIKKDGSKKWHHRNSVDFFIENKFSDKHVQGKLKQMGFEKCKKIIACFHVSDPSVIKYAKTKKIETIEIKDKIPELMKVLGDTYYSDDILRTLQLVSKCDVK